MHKSRLSGFIIDCQTDNLDAAAQFWAQALGLSAVRNEDPRESAYVELRAEPKDLQIEVQKVDHPSRVHIDIETDDIEAEVERLEALGATRVAKIRRWVVMEAPTGQRFCIVNPSRPGFERDANKWP